MRVLYIAGATAPDYQCDMLFHGLRELLGADAVDARRPWYMYAADVTPERKRSLYGRGFTVYGRLPELAVDRSDLEAKIRRRHFDLVVYGSVWRSLDSLPLVMRCYPPAQVAFVDGEDHQEIRREVLPLGLYFKRECTRAAGGCIPINFAIPASAVRREVPPKTQAVATVIPGKPETYVFDNEESYHEDYARSAVAVTLKKAGWDCLRHYEIMANGCLPYFIGLERCPSHTMIQLPKRFLRRIQKPLRASRPIPEGVYEACRNYAAERLTTKVLARDFLDAMLAGRRRIPDAGLELAEAVLS